MKNMRFTSLLVIILIFTVSACFGQMNPGKEFIAKKMIENNEDFYAYSDLFGWGTVEYREKGYYWILYSNSDGCLQLSMNGRIRDDDRLTMIRSEKFWQVLRDGDTASFIEPDDYDMLYEKYLNGFRDGTSQDELVRIHSLMQRPGTFRTDGEETYFGCVFKEWTDSFITADSTMEWPGRCNKPAVMEGVKNEFLAFPFFTRFKVMDTFVLKW